MKVAPLTCHIGAELSGVSLTEAAHNDDLFGADRWPWLSGEALAETVLWDTSRHYEGHLKHLAPLTQNART